MNPLFQMMNNNVFNQFQQFQKNFKGDPQQYVQQLLNSGRISQDQYNQAVKMAQQFQQMFMPGAQR